MLTHVKDREEEELLLKWCLETAPQHKELIKELEAHVDILKKNGEVHKGKRTIRLKLISTLRKELKVMKQFFIKRRDPPDKWTTERYQYKRSISEGRKHLYKR